MATILSIATKVPPFPVAQQEAKKFVHQLLVQSNPEMERLLRVFDTGEIQRRYFSAPLPWFAERRTWQEKNDRYVQWAIRLSVEAIEECLTSQRFLQQSIPYGSIDAIFFVSSTGVATPTIDAKIMNQLPFSLHTKRIPLWGLGCAGGASGLARAFEYCQAYPMANVLVVCVELCSLTFQGSDLNKSNVVGTSLFADGVAVALVAGEASPLQKAKMRSYYPAVTATQSVFLRDGEDIMGWRISDNGFHVIFARSIPTLIQQWLPLHLHQFFHYQGLSVEHVDYWIVHPGGRKVLEAYAQAFGVEEASFQIARKILQRFGNMSSATILFVLQETMLQATKPGVGIGLALGPGFSAEFLLLEWTAANTMGFKRIEQRSDLPSTQVVMKG
ncbi:type III polyketide synthase [Rubeoparvulum massiliense]|uniref:type III polyketide synthase n=1 Tax=Rubeoparvulum massiliense TaxID=1631346 RepID=UPI000977773A|nr:3-oxoacyl-[acyl-carrier-protein] synthase III C-terminal domain-containing protein [Rubeoparvulum massiliense]